MTPVGRNTLQFALAARGAQYSGYDYTDAFSEIGENGAELLFSGNEDVGSTYIRFDLSPRAREAWRVFIDMLYEQGLA